MVQRRWPTSGGDYNNFVNWQTNIGRPVGNEAFAQWLERRARLMRQQGVGNPDQGRQGNNQQRPGVMYSLSGGLDPGGGEAATPPPSDEPPGPTWNLPLDTTPPYEPPGPTWNLPLPPPPSPPPAAQSAPQPPPATPTVQQPNNTATGAPETPPNPVPAGLTNEQVGKGLLDMIGDITKGIQDAAQNLNTSAQPPATQPPANRHDPNDEAYWDQYYNAVPQGGWGKPIRAGTFLTFDGAVIPVDYDPSQDNPKWGVNGTMETAMRRAIRWATDMMRAGKASNFQNALSFAMATLGSDYLRAKATGSTVPGDRDGVAWNGGLGWDATKLRYVAYREKYDDKVDYSKPTVTYKRGVNDRAYDENGNPIPGATSDGGRGNGNNGQGNGGQNGGGMSGTQPGASHTNGMLGNTPVADWAALIDRIMSDSSGGEAAKALAMARGQTGTTKSRYGMMADDLYGKMLYAYSVLSGGGGNPDFSSGINDFMTAMKDNDITRFMHQAGANVVGSDMSSFTDPEVEAFLKAALAARGVGQGAFGTTAGNASLRELLNAQDTRNWSDPHASGAEGLGTALRNPNSGALASQANDFRSLFNRYLGLTNAPGVAPPVVPGQRS